MNITKKTSYSNTTLYYNRPLKYIVIHYTAGSSSRTGSARGVATMFSNPAVGGSADFIVDDTEIVQFSPDIKNYYCWHSGVDYSGGTAPYWGKCTNANSIGIEICSTNLNYSAKDPANSPKWSFTDAAVETALELVRYLMQTYNIPVSNVIRHWDVCRKPCPGIIGWNTYNGSNESKWNAFKAKLGSTSSTTNTTTSSKNTTTNTQTTTTNSSSIKAGSTVKLSSNATYYDGQSMPSWVKGKTWIVNSINGDRVVIDKSADGQNSIMSAVNKKYVSLSSASTQTKTTTKAATKFTEYKVRVTVSALNIRKGAGTGYAVTGTITDGGVYTIVGEATGTGATKWLKLKSGAGYIASDYTKKV